MIDHESVVTTERVIRFPRGRELSTDLWNYHNIIDNIRCDKDKIWCSFSFIIIRKIMFLTSLQK